MYYDWNGLVEQKMKEDEWIKIPSSLYIFGDVTEPDSSNAMMKVLQT